MSGGSLTRRLPWPRLGAPIVVVMVALVTGVNATRDLLFTNDSYIYALVSQEIRASGRARMPIVQILDRPDAAVTVPLNDKPPVYPGLLALAGGVEPGRTWPARIVAVASHVTASLATCAIAGMLAGPAASLAAGVAVAVGYPLRYVAHHAWSEPPFIAFALISIAALLAARRSGRRSLGWLALAGASASAAIATRFAGAALLGTLGYEVLRTAKRGPRAAVRSGWVTLLLPTVTLAALMARNVIDTGHIRGWSSPLGRIGRSTLEALGGVGRATLELLGPGRFGALFLVALVVPLAVSPTHREQTLGVRRERGLDVVVVSLLAYLAFITHAMAEVQWRFEPRFFVPLVPLLWVIAVAVWQPPHASSLRARILGSLFGLVAWTTVVAASAGAPVPGRPEPAASKTLAWLRQQVRPELRIATNVGPELAFELGVPVLWLPHRTWDPTTPLQADLDARLPEKMSELGARFLVLMCRRSGLDAEDWGRFIAKLSRREWSGSPFVQVFEAPGGVVYELVARRDEPG